MLEQCPGPLVAEVAGSWSRSQVAASPERCSGALVASVGKIGCGAVLRRSGAHHGEERVGRFPGEVTSHRVETGGRGRLPTRWRDPARLLDPRDGGRRPDSGLG